MAIPVLDKMDIERAVDYVNKNSLTPRSNAKYYFVWDDGKEYQSYQIAKYARWLKNGGDGRPSTEGLDAGEAARCLEKLGYSIIEKGDTSEMNFLFDKKRYQNWLAKYKAAFPEWWTDERYKWVAVKQFQDTWNIGAEDFASMLEVALSKTANLLAANNYFPKKLILQLAQVAPEKVRAMFESLYNEGEDVVSRIERFKGDSNQLFEECRKQAKVDEGQHFQSESAITTYLWLRYPDKYYLYKHREAKSFAEQMGSELTFTKGRYDSNLQNFFKLYNAVNDEIVKDRDLKSMLGDLIDSECYPDPKEITLTFDFGFFVSRTNDDLIHDENDFEKDEAEVETVKASTNSPKNFILYGPPGTGKTYHTVEFAYKLAHPGSDTQMDHGIAKKWYDEQLEKDDGQVVFTTFHQSYNYEEFIEGIRPVMEGKGDENDATLKYKVEAGVFKSFCERAKLNEGDVVEVVSELSDNPGIAEKNTRPYIFIIDEINRGNVSRIFGELITLLEESKREGADDEQAAILPYSKERFTIPSNVYVIGTMNTADRSLTQLDTALRRRFEFIEMNPNSKLLSQKITEGIDGKPINLQNVLDAMNARIAALYDRDHMIGHSYLMKVESLKDLQDAFATKIIPLLQEYFYDDYSKIKDVLNDHDDEQCFVKKIEIEPKWIQNTPNINADVELFEINRDRENWDSDLFRAIYSNNNDNVHQEDGGQDSNTES